MSWLVGQLTIKIKERVSGHDARGLCPWWDGDAMWCETCTSVEHTDLLDISQGLDASTISLFRRLLWLRYSRETTQNVVLFQLILHFSGSDGLTRLRYFGTAEVAEDYCGRDQLGSAACRSEGRPLKFTVQRDLEGEVGD